MKDTHSNLHLRPYMLLLLAVTFLTTTIIFVTLVIKGETSPLLLNGLSLGLVSIICTGSALAGASLHDKHYLSLFVRSIAFITISSALGAFIFSGLALWDVFTAPVIWNIAALLTILTMVGGAFSVLVPLYIQSHVQHHSISIVIITTLVSGLLCLCISASYVLQLAIIPQAVYPRLIAATAAPTVLGLFLLPIVIHFLHIIEHITAGRS